MPRRKQYAYALPSGFSKPKHPQDWRHCILQLARVGDILNVIPIARRIHDEIKYSKVPMMCHSSMIGTLKRVSYVQPLEWTGGIWDLDGAMAEASSRFTSVLVPQRYSERRLENKITQSFNRDQYVACGYGRYFGLAPLEIDNRNAEEEERIASSLRNPNNLECYIRPFICVSLGGVSSPFPHKELVLNALGQYSHSHDIIDLGAVTVEHFTDLLGLLDRCSVLVTSDTATLHLSNGSHCRVVAFISDLHGSDWYGSEVIRTPLLSVRYRDVPGRMDEIEAAIHGSLGFSEESSLNGRIHHLVNVREKRDERVERTIAKWSILYDSGAMIPIHIPDPPRNSKDALGCHRRLPFIRDIIETAILSPGIRDTDIIMFTNDDVVVTSDCLRFIRHKLQHVPIVTCHRVDIPSINDINPITTRYGFRFGRRHTGRDVVAFKAGWMRSNFHMILDFVIGASMWDYQVAVMARKLAGYDSTCDTISWVVPQCEVPLGCVYHEDHTPEWHHAYNIKSPSEHNNTLLTDEWCRANCPSFDITIFNKFIGNV